MLILACALVACGNTTPMAMPDSGTVMLPDGGGMACMNHIPDPANGDPMYGTLNGRSFQEFSYMGMPTQLSDCDGNMHSFYGGNYCDPAVRFTVVSIAAGWCAPCMAESSMMTARITEPYGPRGVRVIQVLVQDPSYSRPDTAFCQSWVDRFALRGNLELIDPDQVTNRYFPMGALPSTLIIDNMGVIRFHEDGATDGLTSLTTALDRLLAGG